MRALRYLLLFPLAAVALSLQGLQPAASASSEQCLTDLLSLWTGHESTLENSAKEVRGKALGLRKAARIFAAAGQADDCRTVHEGLATFLENQRQNLISKGVVPTLEKERRLERLAAAQPLAQVGESLRISELIGLDTVNPKDERLGEVEDIIVETESGRSTHLILSSGGILGIGEEFRVVPLDALRLTAAA